MCRAGVLQKLRYPGPVPADTRAFRKVGTSFVLRPAGSERHPCVEGEKGEVQGCAGGSSVPGSCRRCCCGALGEAAGAGCRRAMHRSPLGSTRRCPLALPDFMQTKRLSLVLPGAPAFLELSPERSWKHSRRSWIYAGVTGCHLSNSSKTSGRGCQPRPPPWALLPT